LLRLHTDNPRREGSNKKFKLAALAALLGTLALAPIQARGQAGNITPAGRLASFWATQQQTVWSRMVSENNVWMKYLLLAANDTTGQRGIENQGTAGAWAYLYTGNPQYAQNSWQALQPYVTTGKLPNGNNENAIRQFFGLYVLVYEAIKPQLTSAQQQQFITYLNHIALRARTSIMTGNANGLIGCYLGLSLWDTISVGENPLAGTLLKGTFNDAGVWKPFGGLTYNPNLGPRGSARNAIHDYILKSVPAPGQGGIWLEGTQYVDASLEPLLLYTQILDQITGRHNFPELDAAMPQLGVGIINLLTPTLNDEFQLGDEEFPHQLHLAVHMTAAAELAARLQGTTVGANLQWLVNYWAAHTYAYNSFALRLYLLWNPYAAAQDFRSAHPPLNGIGFSLYRSGWSAQKDSIFGVDTMAMTGVDHSQQTEVFRSFSLYRKGEWAIEHPISYGGMGLTADGNNTVVVGGLGVMWQHGVGACEEGANYLYQRAETSGSRYRSTFFKPAPPYVYEQTGSVVYAHGANATADVIVVADRIMASNPLFVSSFPNGWRTVDAQSIWNAENSVYPAGPLQWTLHMPVAPYIENGAILWDAGTQHVVSQELTPSPSETAFTTIDEAATNPDGTFKLFNYGYVLPSQRKWQVRETIADGKEWHFLLHALSVYDGATPAITEVDGNGVSGALVEPANEVGVLALFSNNPNGRQIENSYTITFDAANTETDLYLADLDSHLPWMASMPGVSPAPISFGPGGLGQIAVLGTGKHTVTISW